MFNSQCSFIIDAKFPDNPIHISSYLATLQFSSIDSDFRVSSTTRRSGMCNHGISKELQDHGKSDTRQTSRFTCLGDSCFRNRTSRTPPPRRGPPRPNISFACMNCHESGEFCDAVLETGDSTGNSGI